MAKVLILDIETAPNVAYVWRFFKENISPKQILENSWIMAYAYKWLGSPDITYRDAFWAKEKGERELVEDLIEVLDQADIVIAHNAKGFDIPTILGRALIYGIQPPSPFKVIDTYEVAKRTFKFGSNSLERLAIVLDCKHKKGGHKKFPGFELWLECLKDNPNAWAEMKEYNILDVLVLEDLYLKLRPYISNHPNVNVFDDDHELRCTKCGSDSIQRRGFAHTNIGKYQRYSCNSCGGWSRTRYLENTVQRRKALLANA